MASLLADQGTLADLSSKFAGRIPVRIHFLDNSSKVFLSEPNTTSIKDLVTQCLEKYGVLDVANVLPYYSLYESRNGGAIDGHLAMDLKVQDVIQSWADAGVSKTAKFLFMIRLYLPSITGLEMRDVVAHHLGKSREELATAEYLEHAEVIDSNALHLQFIQAVYNVITGRYPTSAEEALKLGAVHFLLKFGRFSADKHKVGFLSSRIFEFIPIKHLKSGGGSKALSSSATADWEHKLYEEIKRVSADLVETDSAGVHEEVDEEGGIAGADVSNGANLLFRLHGRAVSAQRCYLETVYKMEPVFGATFFKCTQKSVRALPETLQIGVYSDGLHLCDKHKTLLRSFYIEDIFRWGFKPAVMFYFEIAPDDDYGTGTLEFDTAEGKEMSDLLTDYALAFLKEREAEELRAQSLGPHPSLGTHPSKHPNGSLNGAHVPAPPPRPNGSVGSHGASNGQQLSSQAAAVRIQALYRGFALRNDWAKEDAAILIQAVYRGYRARVLISKLIEDMIQSGQL